MTDVSYGEAQRQSSGKGALNATGTSNAFTAAFGYRTSRAEGNGLPKIKSPATHG